MTKGVMYDNFYKNWDKRSCKRHKYIRKIIIEIEDKKTRKSKELFISHYTR